MFKLEAHSFAQRIPPLMMILDDLLGLHVQFSCRVSRCCRPLRFVDTLGCWLGSFGTVDGLKGAPVKAETLNLTLSGRCHKIVHQTSKLCLVCMDLFNTHQTCKTIATCFMEFWGGVNTQYIECLGMIIWNVMFWVVDFSRWTKKTGAWS